MPGTNNPLGVVQAVRMRVSLLDSNGVPTPGAGKGYVSSALTELVFKPVTADAPDIEERNGEGVVCVSYKGKKTLKRIEGTIKLCTPDPYLLVFLAGASLIDIGNAKPFGWQYPAIGEINPPPISIEVWSRRVDDGVEDINFPYEWGVLPRVKNMMLGEHKLANGAVMPTIDFEGYENPNWFDGPDERWIGASDRVFNSQPIPASYLPVASTSPTATVAS